ncbi:TatD family hydrolase [Marinifilum sp.]|uniref:TatD family hydrolase n=1 Tax=Marinifilum sp. TaxID=2033137 RepID=UPI003BACFF3A
MSLIPYIDIHTHQLISRREIISVLNLNANDQDKNFPANTSYSIGIHPWDIEKLKFDSAIDYLEEYLLSLNPIAIGEIGLDKMISTDMEIQERVFVEQIHVAKIQQIPMIIHCVKAQEEILKVKNNHDTRTAWILHGYNKNLQVAEAFLKQGFYLSFGEALLRNEKLQSVFKLIPLDRIFLETDEKEISVKEVYRRAAEIKEIEIEALKEQMLLNFMKCF